MRMSATGKPEEGRDETERRHPVRAPLLSGGNPDRVREGKASGVPK
jgi:hypothetical protein